MGLLDIWRIDVTEWHEDPWAPLRRRKSITGEKLGGYTMRRRVNGQWEYRNMTEGERAEYTENNVIW
jgi:hypothetical protein